MNDRSIFSISIEKFSIEVHVNLESSAAETANFSLSHTDKEFVFAVADLWLRKAEDRRIICSEFETGNALETLRAFSKALLSPAEISAQVEVVPIGGLCAWMQTYWDRINDGLATDIDESTYDVLVPHCVIAEGNGCVAVYQHRGTPIIETSSKSDDGVPLRAYSPYAPQELAHEVEMISRSIAAEVRTFSKAH